MGDWYLNKCVRGGESAAEVKRKVLLRAAHVVKTGHSLLISNSSYSEFQILDLNTGKFSRTPFTLLGDSGIGTIVLLGSVVYTLGKRRIGDIPPDYSDYYANIKGQNDIVAVHEGLSYFDLNKPEIGWNKGPLVKEDQYFPNCVALCGMLYVLRSSTFTCFGEVYDPKLNTWHPLPKAPPFSGGYKVSPPLVSDPLHGRILVHFDISGPPFASPIYAYYPADARWDCLVDNFDEAWAGPLAFVDGVIYFFARKCKQLVQAYDLDKKLWLKVVLSSEFDKDYSRCNFDALHHLGNGLMCFTTYSYSYCNMDPTVVKDHTVLLAVQFKVQRATHRDEVLLTPLSSISCPLQSCCQIHGQIAI